VLLETGLDKCYRAGIDDDCLLLELPAPTFLAIFGTSAVCWAELHLKLFRCRCTMKAVLSHPYAREVLLQHARQSEFAHSLSFCDAVSRLAQIPPELAAASKAIGHDIATTYLEDGAVSPVRLPEEARAPIIEALRLGEAVPPSLLVAAKETVVLKLEGGLLPGYRSSAHFSQLLQSMGGDDSSTCSAELMTLAHASQLYELQRRSSAVRSAQPPPKRWPSVSRVLHGGAQRDEVRIELQQS